MKNPFVYGETVSGDNFCDRVLEMKEGKPPNFPGMFVRRGPWRCWPRLLKSDNPVNCNTDISDMS